MPPHNLLNLFHNNDESTQKASNIRHSIESPSQILASIDLIKSELNKVKQGAKSFFADIHALGFDAIPDAIVLCNYVSNILHGNLIDDRRLEMEQIIRMLYTLPKDSQIGALLSKVFIYSLWTALPHPPASFPNEAGYQWRSADGSNNNLLFPNIGKAGQKYVQDCPSKRPQANVYDVLPDPGRIFDELLKRPSTKDGFRANESFVSSNLFYFATLITHDLFNTHSTERSINLATSYLDLSPLYGCDKDAQASVRTGNNGLLYPDQFADNRFWLQPAGVTALVVLFNRNHNYLAETLLRINENGRFNIEDDKQRDEALFQTARLINERTYVNIILHDYLRVILGINRAQSLWTLDVLQDFSSIGASGDVPRATGNQCSIEFNFIYRWHHATSLADEKWLEDMFTEMFGEWQQMDKNTMFKKMGHAMSKIDKIKSRQLNRRDDGRFDDKDLARALIDGCKNVAGAFGGQNTPAVLRNIEISGILHARTIGLCTLNEYRERINLKKYQSFDQLNPKLADRLAKLYKTIDDVELYPGILCESEKPSIGGSGICANYTTSFAILSDAVALVRGDRFHSKHATHFNLTNFGMEDSQSDQTIHYGTLLGSKLISRHLKGIFNDNSIYATFPFTTPDETRKNLANNQTNYDFHEPLQSI